MVRAGFIYLVSLKTACGYGGQWKLRGSAVLIMRCTATPRSCDICYQPSGRETRHLFIGLIPPPIPPLSLTLLFVCTVLELCVCVECVECVCVNANPYTQSDMWSHVRTGPESECSWPTPMYKCDRCVKKGVIVCRLWLTLNKPSTYSYGNTF